MSFLTNMNDDQKNRIFRTFKQGLWGLALTAGVLVVDTAVELVNVQVKSAVIAGLLVQILTTVRAAVQNARGK